MRRPFQTLLSTALIAVLLFETAALATTEKPNWTVGPDHDYLSPMKEPAPSATAVGWANLFVPGLGATLRGNPKLGLFEAAATVGTYYGGTFLAEDAHFTMDGSVDIPNQAHISRQLTGQFLQEFGLKTHMYNTFYNYQQAALDPANAEVQRGYEQPIYTGNYKDLLSAPFEPENWATAWFYIPVALSTAYLYADYKNGDGIAKRPGQSGLGQDSLFGFTQGIGVPLGSAFGEEALWRGFFQREFRHYTHSLTAAIIMQDLIFMSVHSPELRPGAAIGGIYFGLYANHTNGDLGPLVATHFWVDFISAMFTWMKFRRAEGRGAPLSVRLSIPIF